MLVDKQSELMSDLLFTVHQHGGDDVTSKSIQCRMIRIETAEFIHEYFSRKNSSLTVRLVL